MIAKELIDILEERAKVYGDKVFLINPAQPENRLTYQSLFAMVLKRGQELAQLGVKEGDRVGLPVLGADQFVPQWLALLSIKAVVVPMPGQAPMSDWQRALDAVGARWALTCNEQKWHLSSRNTSILGPRLPHGSYRGGGVVLWTSGTTGEPKPVGVGTDALLHTAAQVGHVHRLTPEDVGYSPLPLFHINGEVVAVLASLVAGSTIVIPDRFRRTKFWTQVNDFGATWINAVPSILAILATDDSQLSNARLLRFVRSASMALPEVVAERWQKRWDIPIVETYGLSEAASQVTANGLDSKDRRAGSVGRPQGIALRIVNENGVVLQPNHRGLVEIKGPSVIDPQWGPNQWAHSTTRHGWYGTGDVGFVDEDGFVYLKGRNREVINRGGEKIFPREVEEVIRRFPGVVDCAVVGAPHAILGEEVVAFVVVEMADPESTARRVREYVTGLLAAHKVPSRIIPVTSLPTGSTGKVARRILQQVAGAEIIS